MTRPVLMLDESNRQMYLFYTIDYLTRGKIYYKTSPVGATLRFASGQGTRAIGYSGADINDASGSKDPVNSTTGLVVLASDERNNTYYHAEMDLPAPADTVAPSKPTVTVTPGPGSAEVRWTEATDNVAVAGYRVVRDNAVIWETTSGTSYTDAPVSAGSHSYAVTAFDGAGNTSTSATVTVTVPAPSGPAAPTGPDRDGDLADLGRPDVERARQHRRRRRLPRLPGLDAAGQPDRDRLHGHRRRRRDDVHLRGRERGQRRPGVGPDHGHGDDARGARERHRRAGGEHHAERRDDVARDPDPRGRAGRRRHVRGARDGEHPEGHAAERVEAGRGAAEQHHAEGVRLLAGGRLRGARVAGVEAVEPQAGRGQRRGLHRGVRGVAGGGERVAVRLLHDEDRDCPDHDEDGASEGGRGVRDRDGDDGDPAGGADRAGGPERDQRVDRGDAGGRRLPPGHAGSRRLADRGGRRGRAVRERGPRAHADRLTDSRRGNTGARGPSPRAPVRVGCVGPERPDPTGRTGRVRSARARARGRARGRGRGRGRRSRPPPSACPRRAPRW